MVRIVGFFCLGVGWHERSGRIRVTLWLWRIASLFLGFSLFTLRNAIAQARSHNQTGLADFNGDGAVFAVALLIGRNVGQRVLMMQFVRDALKSVGRVLDIFGTHIKRA